MLSHPQVERLKIILTCIVSSFLVGVRHFLVGTYTAFSIELKRLQSARHNEAERESLLLWLGLAGQAFLLYTIGLAFEFLIVPLNSYFHHLLFGKDDASRWVLDILYVTFWCAPAVVVCRIYGAKFASLVFERTWDDCIQADETCAKKTEISVSQKFISTFSPLMTYGVIVLIQLWTNVLLFRWACDLLLSIIYSFYAFDYSWSRRSEQFHRRCDLVSDHWSYLSGFSILFVILLKKASANSYLFGTVAYVSMYPILVIVATRIDTHQMLSDHKAPFKLAIIEPAHIMARSLIGIIRWTEKALIRRYDPITTKQT